MGNELATTRQLTPENWGMIQSVANAAYLSRKFGVTEGEAAIKMLFCFENSLPLTAANTGLYIVNGKIAAQSNVIAAQIRRHPDYDYRIDVLTDDECSVTIMRRNGDSWTDIGMSVFTMEDARRAGIAGDTYQKYPRNMLFGRALTNGYRWFCPDVFSQPLYTPEELGKNNDDDAVEVWVTEIKPPSPTDAPTEPALPDLSDLVTQYGADAVMAANGGQIPATAEDVARVAEVLNGA